MKRNFLKIGMITIILLLLSGITQSQADPDTSKVGVNNNDEFTFVVDSYTPFILFGQTAYSPGWDMDTYDDLNVKVGDEFTMKIVDNTLQQSFWYDFPTIILVMFSNSTHSVTSEYDLFDDFDDLIMFTDWAFWEANLTAEAELFDDDISWSVTNGEENFELKQSGTVTEDGLTSTGDIHIIYEKSTGVLLYSKTKVKLSGEGITLDINDVIRRVGFSAPGGDSDGGFLPGFEWFTIGIVIFLIPARKIKNRRA